MSSNLLAKTVNTYETVVLGKEERTSVLFTGVFIPLVLHFPVIDGVRSRSSATSTTG